MEGETSSKAISNNTCGFCKTETAKYCCPRCNILYCSLDCYTSPDHLNCSEEFYKECVKENIDVNDAESKAKMMEILQRSHAANKEIPSKPNELDSDDDEDLGDRLAGLDLDDAELVWSKLTEAERQEFEAFLKSDISKFVPKWEPWWMFHCSKKVVDLSQVSTFKSNCPKLENIKDILTLSPKYPADAVKYNIINVLTAYVFTARYFNGEYHDFPKEACSCITNLGLSFKINHNFEDFATAVESVHCQIINSRTWITADEDNINNMREDIHLILKGPHKSERKYYMFAALSDLYRLFDSAVNSYKVKKGDSFAAKFPDNSFPVVMYDSKQKIRHHMKKIEFYLAYVKDCYQSNL